MMNSMRNNWLSTSQVSYAVTIKIKWLTIRY
ncbi:bacterial NAD-glutamate dehydrogenase family protein, partial [Vibrio parahaemolyticus EKP-008]